MYVTTGRWQRLTVDSSYAIARSGVCLRLALLKWHNCDWVLVWVCWGQSRAERNSPPYLVVPLRTYHLRPPGYGTNLDFFDMSMRVRTYCLRDHPSVLLYISVCLSLCTFMCVYKVYDDNGNIIFISDKDYRNNKTIMMLMKIYLMMEEAPFITLNMTYYWYQSNEWLCNYCW